ncbi:InlB B-repeat-containing protein [Lactococcus insecticola]|uniref:DUF5648 domain-containing protein n=1 Tax=Pseudolactococcus insecticola TaxID=2709158 RepID=A0A6A0B592_9LACT|nr:InlB B-repeat-containing protein [Lactococcus insecticola]GFH40392.1 hypothetical protein Hs20B_07900 [Lactococcus insecticola]
MKNSIKVALGLSAVLVAGDLFVGETKTFASVVGSQGMYRVYNKNSGEHFYTASVAEKNNLVKLGWKYEGIGWNAPTSSNTPVYRVYNKNAGDHHYTTDKGEKDALVKLGWKYEGIGWYSDDAKGVKLLRAYNPNAKAGSHNYTANAAEQKMLVSVGWRNEGTAWYGLKTSVPATKTPYIPVTKTVNKTVNVSDTGETLAATTGYTKVSSKATTVSTTAKNGDVTKTVTTTVTWHKPVTKTVNKTVNVSDTGETLTATTGYTKISSKATTVSTTAKNGDVTKTVTTTVTWHKPVTKTVNKTVNVSDTGETLTATTGYTKISSKATTTSTTAKNGDITKTVTTTVTWHKPVTKTVNKTVNVSDTGETLAATTGYTKVSSKSITVSTTAKNGDVTKTVTTTVTWHKPVTKTVNKTVNVSDTGETLTSTTGYKKVLSKATTVSTTAKNGDVTKTVTTTVTWHKPVTKTVNKTVNVSDTGETLAATTGYTKISSKATTVSTTAKNGDVTKTVTTTVTWHKPVTKTVNKTVNVSDTNETLAATTGYTKISSKATTASTTAKNGDVTKTVTTTVTWHKPVTKTVNKTVNVSDTGETLTSTTGYTKVSSKSTTVSTTAKNGDVTKTVTTTVTWHKLFIVAYNSNGGSTTPASQTITSGTSITAPTAPTKFAYTFVGWKRSDDNAIVQAGVSFTPTANTTLTAQWTAPTTITSPYNGTNNINTAGKNVYYKFTPRTSGSYTILSTGSVDSYVTLYDASGTEISSDDDSNGSFNFKLTANLTSGTTYYYVAKLYNPNATGSYSINLNQGVTVSYNANGGSAAPASQTVGNGSSVILSTDAPTKDSSSTGYKFLGWSTSSSATSASYSAGATISNVTSDITLYAVWQSYAKVTFTSAEKNTINANNTKLASLRARETALNGNYYQTQPSASGATTYVTGKLTPTAVQLAVDWLNYYRNLSGMGNVSNTQTLTDIAQVTASVESYMRVMTHSLSYNYPNKPAAISDADWSTANTGASSSNLYSYGLGGGATIESLMNGWFTDSNNAMGGAASVGHRQTMLGDVTGVGFGTAPNSSALYMQDMGYARSSSKILSVPGNSLFSVQDATDIKNKCSIDFGSNSGYSFTSLPTVTIKNNSQNITVNAESVTDTSMYSRLGGDSITFSIPNSLPLAADNSYTITVNLGSSTYSYTFKLYDNTKSY